MSTFLTIFFTVLMLIIIEILILVMGFAYMGLIFGFENIEIIKGFARRGSRYASIIVNIYNFIKEKYNIK